MADLSPATQAVLDAYHRELPPDNKPGGLVAALRAAAVYSYCPVDRQRLVTIAAELESSCVW